MAGTTFTIDASQAFQQFDAIERRLGDLNTSAKRAAEATKNVFTPGGNLARQEVAALDQVQREYNELVRAVSVLKGSLKNAWDPRAVKTYTLAISQAEDEIKKLEQAAEAVGVDLNKALTPPKQTGGGFGPTLLNNLGGAALVTGAVAGFGAAIREGVALNAEYEKVKTSLAVILKDSGKADVLLGKLNRFAAQTPFDSAAVNDAAKSLLAFGVSEDEVITKLQEIGTVSAAVGKDFNELTTIYGKARIAGVLYAEDINQLVEAGVPIIGEFAKQMGVSESQVKKLASQGKIGFNELQTAFTNLTSEGGKFDGLLEAQGKTAAGLQSTLRDVFSQRLRDATAGFSALIKEITSGFISLLDNTQKESAALEDQRIGFLTLANEIKLTNVGTEARSALIEKLQAQYPQYIGNIDKEKVTNEQLQPILDNINKSYVIRIALQKSQEKLQPLLEKQAEAENRAAESRAKQNRILAQGIELTGIDVSGLKTKEEQVSAVTKALQSQAKFGISSAQDRLDGENRLRQPLNEQARLLGEIQALSGQTGVRTSQLTAAEKEATEATRQREEVVTELKKTYGELFDIATAVPKTPKAAEVKPADTRAAEKEAQKRIAEAEKLAASIEKIQAAITPDDLNADLAQVNKKYDDLIKATEEGITQLQAIERQRGLSPEQRAQLEELATFTVQLEERRLDELSAVLQDFNEKEQAIQDEQIKRQQALIAKGVEGEKQALEEQKAIRDAEIKLQEERGRRLVLIAQKSGADEKDVAELQRQFDLANQKARLESELKFQEGLLAIIGSGNEQQAAEIKRIIAQIQAELGTLSIEIETPDVKGKGKPKSLLELLGIKLDDESAQILADSAQKIIGGIQEITAAKVAAAEAELQIANDKVDEAEAALDTELRLAELGFASNVTLRQKELEDAKKNQQAALVQKQKAAKQQLLIDSLTQASSIATSATNLIQSWSTLPFGIGLIAAAAQIAGLIAFIASTKSKARAISKARYGTSGYIDEQGIVHGQYHEHGGHLLEVEKDEMVQVGQDGSRKRIEVVRRERVREYMDLLTAANKGDKKELVLQALKLADIRSLPPSVQKEIFGTIRENETTNTATETVREAQRFERSVRDSIRASTANITTNNNSSTRETSAVTERNSTAFKESQTAILREYVTNSTALTSEQQSKVIERSREIIFSAAITEIQKLTPAIQQEVLQQFQSVVFNNSRAAQYHTTGPTVNQRKVTNRVFGKGDSAVTVRIDGNDSKRTNELLERLILLQIEQSKAEKWSADGKTKIRGGVKTRYLN